MPEYLSIGDFSRATHMTIRTLRHYHQIGLLEPTEVDPRTGHRRYATSQIPTVQVIRRFRDLGMPLEEAGRSSGRAADDRESSAEPLNNPLRSGLRAGEAAVMHLSHLGLPVRDHRRSQEFYSAYFGFDPATAQEYADGTVIIRNADGFDLALHPSEHIEPSPAFLHAGFRVTAPDEVRALLARMDADGVTIVERDEERAYIAFKCRDPDGHRIEVYWEPPLPA